MYKKQQFSKVTVLGCFLWHFDEAVPGPPGCCPPRAVSPCWQLGTAGPRALVRVLWGSRHHPRCVDLAASLRRARAACCTPSLQLDLFSSALQAANKSPDDSNGKASSSVHACFVYCL